MWEWHMSVCSGGDLTSSGPRDIIIVINCWLVLVMQWSWVVQASGKSINQWKVLWCEHSCLSVCVCVSVWVTEASYLITVPLAPPAVVSMTLLVRLTRRSSSSRPSSSAQCSSVWLDWFLMAQPPARHGKRAKLILNIHTHSHLIFTHTPMSTLGATRVLVSCLSSQECRAVFW